MSSNVDINPNVDTVSAEDQRLRRLYGNRKPVGHLDRFRQAKGRKQYFDSGEYAMAQAGKGDAIDVGAMGRQHPSPESIPHPVTPTNGNNSPAPGGKVPGAVQTTGILISQGSQSAGSPIKETSFLSRETSADDMDDDTEETNQEHNDGQQNQQQVHDSVQHGADGLPIRS